MNYILFDGPEREDLLPLTFTKPVAEMRIGILTLREKWERYTGKTSTLTQDYLQEKWPIRLAEKNLFINPAFLPNDDLWNRINGLQTGEGLWCNGRIVAYASGKPVEDFKKMKAVELEEEPMSIAHPWDIFEKNFEAIEADFKVLTKGRKSAPIPDSFYVVNREQIFVEEGARLYSGSLNAENGPIYIGKDAEIREGAHIRGPFSLGEGGRVQMGCKVYEGTTVGPHCVIGGEVKNAVLFGYSNKGHEGYLGNSVIGEWCNLGADTNNSNLKNNYSEVRLWSYAQERFAHTGLQKCGLIMGDHSKSAINTMFNTGTVTGVSANVFGAGFPRNFIPSFSWGGKDKLRTYQLKSAFETAEEVMRLAGRSFDEVEQRILEAVFAITEGYRRF